VHLWATTDPNDVIGLVGDPRPWALWEQGQYAKLQDAVREHVVVVGARAALDVFDGNPPGRHAIIYADRRPSLSNAAVDIQALMVRTRNISYASTVSEAFDQCDQPTLHVLGGRNTWVAFMPYALVVHRLVLHDALHPTAGSIAFPAGTIPLQIDAHRPFPADGAAFYQETLFLHPKKAVTRTLPTLCDAPLDADGGDHEPSPMGGWHKRFRMARTRPALSAPEEAPQPARSTDDGQHDPELQMAIMLSLGYDPALLAGKYPDQPQSVLPQGKGGADGDDHARQGLLSECPLSWLAARCDIVLAGVLLAWMRPRDMMMLARASPNARFVMADLLTRNDDPNANGLAKLLGSGCRASTYLSIGVSHQPLLATLSPRDLAWPGKVGACWLLYATLPAMETLATRFEARVRDLVMHATGAPLSLSLVDLMPVGTRWPTEGLVSLMTWSMATRCGGVVRRCLDLAKRMTHHARLFARIGTGPDADLWESNRTLKKRRYAMAAHLVELLFGRPANDTNSGGENASGSGKRKRDGDRAFETPSAQRQRRLLESVPIERLCRLLEGDVWLPALDVALAAGRTRSRLLLRMACQLAMQNMRAGTSFVSGTSIVYALDGRDVVRQPHVRASVSALLADYALQGLLMGRRPDDPPALLPRPTLEEQVRYAARVYGSPEGVQEKDTVDAMDAVPQSEDPRIAFFKEVHTALIADALPLIADAHNGQATDIQLDLAQTLYAVASGTYGWYLEDVHSTGTQLVEGDPTCGPLAADALGQWVSAMVNKHIPREPCSHSGDAQHADVRGIESVNLAWPTRGQHDRLWTVASALLLSDRADTVEAFYRHLTPRSPQRYLVLSHPWPLSETKSLFDINDKPWCAHNRTSVHDARTGVPAAKQKGSADVARVTLEAVGSDSINTVQEQNDILSRLVRHEYDLFVSVIGHLETYELGNLARASSALGDAVACALAPNSHAHLDALCVDRGLLEYCLGVSPSSSKQKTWRPVKLAPWVLADSAASRMIVRLACDYVPYLEMVTEDAHECLAFIRAQFKAKLMLNVSPGQLKRLPEGNVIRLAYVDTLAQSHEHHKATYDNLDAIASVFVRLLVNTTIAAGALGCGHLLGRCIRIAARLCNLNKYWHSVPSTIPVGVRQGRLWDWARRCADAVRTGDPVSHDPSFGMRRRHDGWLPAGALAHAAGRLHSAPLWYAACTMASLVGDARAPFEDIFWIGATSRATLQGRIGAKEGKSDDDRMIEAHTVLIRALAHGICAGPPPADTILISTDAPDKGDDSLADAVRCTLEKDSFTHTQDLTWKSDRERLIELVNTYQHAALLIVHSGTNEARSVACHLVCAAQRLDSSIARWAL